MLEDFKPWVSQDDLGSSDFVANSILLPNRFLASCAYTRQQCQYGVPEVTAVWVMAFLSQHASQEIDYKEHPVALMASSYVLTVVASWS